MPLYEFNCPTCGPFSSMRRMSESALPMACTECGKESIRIISMPNFAVMAKERRSAYERNEKSAHEPKMQKRSACGCSGTHSCGSASLAAGSAVERKGLAQKGQNDVFQVQTKKTARPWMLGH